jgi:hypothetical protein
VHRRWAKQPGRESAVRTSTEGHHSPFWAATRFARKVVMAIRVGNTARRDWQHPAIRGTPKGGGECRHTTNSGVKQRHGQKPSDFQQ